MEKSKIRKDIADLIISIKDHTDNIDDTGRVPQLELKTILNKIERLYEKAIVLNYLHSHPEIPSKEQVIESIVEKEEEVNKEVEIKEEQIITEIKPEIVIKEEIKITTTEPTTDLNLFGDEMPKTIEKPIEEKKSERKADHAVTKKVSRPAIANLKAAIGLNDKFQMINTLFGGNSTEYNIAIQNFDTAETLESAIGYFNDLQQLYNWDMEDAITKRLLDMVERRYS